MIAILENLSGRKIEKMVGKPESEMYKTALRISGVSKEKAIMFGDRLETDILGANMFGLDTCLVMTGVTKMDHLKDLTKESAPSIILYDLNDALQSFK
jgi:4-nitrophenyl phosphatase